jgi:hypothetical protein
MSLDDKVWYREMKEKESEKNSENKLEHVKTNKPSKNNTFPIWRVIFVTTLIVWLTIFVWFYLIPLIMANSVLTVADRMLKDQLKIISEDQKKAINQEINKIKQPTEQPFPENGSCKMFYSQGKAVATFKVIAGPYNYYVKLVDHFDNPVLDIYVRAGGTAKIRVPLGVYELKWIHGDKWYGNDNLFGSTSFMKSDEPLKFNDEDTKNGKKIFGNTVNFNFLKGYTPLTKISVNEF